jgi:hypothetical protein
MGAVRQVIAVADIVTCRPFFLNGEASRWVPCPIKHLALTSCLANGHFPSARSGASYAVDPRKQIGVVNVISLNSLELTCYQQCVMAKSGGTSTSRKIDVGTTFVTTNRGAMIARR